MMTDTNIIEDDALEQASGGVSYNIQDDPLYKKFVEILHHEKKETVTGMDTRAGFIEEFQAWVRSGSPENIREWYAENKKKVLG